MSQTYEDRPTLEQWNALAESIPQIVMGTYTGNSPELSGKTQTFTVGFRPKLVVVYAIRTSDIANYSLVFGESGFTDDYSNVTLGWVTDDGFAIRNAYFNREIYPKTNAINVNYQYIAIG